MGTNQYGPVGSGGVKIATKSKKKPAPVRRSTGVSQRTSVEAKKQKKPRRSLNIFGEIARHFQGD